MLHEIAVDAKPEPEKDPDEKIMEEIKDFAQIEGFGPC
jgi:hypothetical protein